jgi:K+-sensing histidine kinase KdpD
MNAKGTGLGMNICKRIIEQMGGKCAIESEEGQGTEVTIDMQLKATDLLVEIPNHSSMLQEQIDDLLNTVQFK